MFPSPAATRTIQRDCNKESTMISESATILIVEDEQDIRELLAYNLEKEGYATVQAADGKEGLDLARSRKPDLIMLTARGEDVDRILGFELGADDYVVKPFNIRELLLRIRAILRRQVMVESNPVLTRHGVSVDPAAHKVTVLGQDVELTATEFRLIEDLLRNAGRVRTREELLAAVWGYQFEGYARTVDTHIRRLRNKLGDAAEIIETVRGVGYRCKE